jgi:hypothetical protein
MFNSFNDLAPMGSFNSGDKDVNKVKGCHHMERAVVIFVDVK